MIPQHEREYLRELALSYKQLCETPENNNKRKNWYAINDLVEGTLPVFTNHYWPLALSEIFPENSYVCKSEEGKEFELYFKTRMFYAQELKDDNVLEPVVYSKIFFSMEDYTDFETKIEFSSDDVMKTGAYEMIPVLVEEEDVNKISMPKLFYDKEKSRAYFQFTEELFGDILIVVKAPYTIPSKIPDEYSWLRGMESTYTDIYDDPEWMHLALGKIRDNFRQRFLLLEEAGIWGTVDHSEPLGSAGLRYSKELPDFRDVHEDFFEHKVKLSDSWAFTCAEVFNCVSNDMHDEFGFQYDKGIVDLFKFMNVGCCEVLDKKINLAASLPNVRKISVSEWCD